MSFMEDFENEFDEFDEPIRQDVILDSKPAPASAFVPSTKIEIDGEEIFVDANSTGTYTAALNLHEARQAEIAIRESLKTFDLKREALTKQIDEIRESMQAQINALRQEQHELDEQSFDLRRNLRDAVARVAQMERLFRQALENELATKRFQQQSLDFDNVTAGLKWREFAFDHQITGAKFLAANKRCILGDKMGLGKSLTSLMACDMMRARRILIVVPDDVVSNFIHEVYKWAPHRQVMSLGRMTKGERAAALMIMGLLDEFICVINYSAWRKDNSLIDSLINIRFDTVILDEAHTIKETTTNAYRGCHKIIMAENSCPECGSAIKQMRGVPATYQHHREFFGCTNASCGWDQNKDVDNNIQREYGYMRSVKNVFPMTGTAILNKPEDLFALLSLVDPKNFHTKNYFVRDYCDIDYYTGKTKFRSGGMATLVNRLSGKWIARDRKSAGVVLPKQEIMTHNLEITEDNYPAQLKVIQQLTKYATIQLSSGKQMSNIAAITLIMRKRQANVWPAGIVQKDENGDVVFTVADDVNESIKVDWCIDPHGEGNLVDLTAEGNMELGERVVVFSQFKGPLIELEKRLSAAGISVVRFDGDTPQAIRDEVKIDFDRSRCRENGREPKWQVVLANYKTGGVGLNFTDCTQTIILDSEWNGGKEDQALGRTDRIGQTEESTVHILEVDRTIDTWMRALIDDKRNLVDGFESTANLALAYMDDVAAGKTM